MSEAEAKAPRIGNTALRFVTALPLIAVVLWLLFAAPSWGFEIFGYLWIAVVASELMAMASPGRRLIQVWGVVACVAMSVALLRGASIAGLTPAVLLGLCVGSLVVSLAQATPLETASRRVGWLMGAPIYVSGTLSTLALMHREPHGGAWVFLSMCIAFLSDTAAYFAGRAFGAHKLAPTLSPKKSIEGSIGGLFGSVGGALLVAFTLLDGVLPVLDAVVLAIVAGSLGQAGDLFESLLKRSCGVKDSGSIMPGHGGLLDRSDALMFTGATTWFYVSWILPLHAAH